MRHADVSVPKLLEYVRRLRVGSVSRRLGYLLELFGIANEAELQSLRTSLTATYIPLDPSVPREGSHLANGASNSTSQPKSCWPSGALD